MVLNLNLAARDVTNANGEITKLIYCSLTNDNKGLRARSYSSEDPCETLRLACLNLVFHIVEYKHTPFVSYIHFNGYRNLWSK